MQLRRLQIIALIALVTPVAALGPSCSSDSANNGTGPVDSADAARKREVLENLAEEVVLPLYEQVDAASAELVTATEAWAASGEAADREAAQAAWRDTIALWQRAELTLFGPAAAMDLAAGGEDLRDAIYSWPLVNPCRVDQLTASEGYGGDLSTQAPNVRGLDALEYLLFDADTDNACPPNLAINADGTWEALGAETIEARRADYAAAAANDVAASVDRLVSWWSPQGDDFAKALATAGAGSAVYPTTQAALNAVSDAMFYLDKETKDMKLAEPAGLSAACPTDTCPEALESQFARVSLSHIRENLAGFAALYYGGDAGGDEPGFDDLLREAGAGDLADRLEARLAAAIAAFEAAEGPLVELLAADRDAVVALHDALQQLTTLVKTEFVSVLDLDLPDRAEGDND